MGQPGRSGTGEVVTSRIFALALIVLAVWIMPFTIFALLIAAKRPAPAPTPVMLIVPQSARTSLDGAGMTGIYISEPHGGQYYIAERSRRGSLKLLWSSMPVEPTAADRRIEARLVPYRIRRQAYRRLNRGLEQ